MYKPPSLLDFWLLYKMKSSWTLYFVLFRELTQNKLIVVNGEIN